MSTKIMPFLFTFSCLLSLSLSYTLTSQDVSNLYQYVSLQIDMNPDIIPKMLRLSFHDCVSPTCDGSINIANENNNGLKEIMDFVYYNWRYTPLIDGSSWYKKKLSLADFLHIYSALAIIKSTTLQPDINLKYIPRIAIRTGRQDFCTGCIYNGVIHVFPGGHDELSKVLSFYMDTYNFNEREIVAISGAHSVGQMSLSNSGFDGQWTMNMNVLDNSYYSTLMDADWLCQGHNVLFDSAEMGMTTITGHASSEESTSADTSTSSTETTTDTDTDTTSTSSECVGGVDYLQLTNLGDPVTCHIGRDEEVITCVFTNDVRTCDVFAADVGEHKFDTNLEINCGSGRIESQDLHTSCSQPICIGLELKEAQLVISNGASRNGGTLPDGPCVQSSRTSSSQNVVVSMSPTSGHASSEESGTGTERRLLGSSSRPCSGYSCSGSQDLPENCDIDDRFYFKNVDNNNINYLHTDIGLFYDISLDECSRFEGCGNSSCSINQCDLSFDNETNTAEYVMEFANSNTAFLDAFVDVFDKLTSHGYDDNLYFLGYFTAETEIITRYALVDSTTPEERRDNNRTLPCSVSDSSSKSRWRTIPGSSSTSTTSTD